MFDNCVVGQKSVTAPPQWYEHRHVTKYDTMTSSSTQPTPDFTIPYTLFQGQAMVSKHAVIHAGVGHLHFLLIFFNKIHQADKK